MGDRMKIHASGEDYLEAVLVLQKKKGMDFHWDTSLISDELPQHPHGLECC